MSWAVALLPVWALLAGAPGDAPALAIDVSEVSNAPEACPTQDQLAEALEARMPGVVARGREANPNLLRLGLAISSEGIARVTISDAAGALRLERDLDLPKSGAAGPGGAHERGGACAAIAETVALIVERYMRHIGYHEPPIPALVEPARPAPAPLPPPAPPPAPRPGGPGRLGLGVAARLPYGASWRLEGLLTGAARVGRLDLAATLGADLPEDEPIPLSSGKGTLRLRTFPARVAVGWTFPVGRRLSLSPAVGGGFDFVLAETRGIDMTRRSRAIEPTMEAGLRAVAALTRRVWIDLQAFQGIDVRPEQFTVMLPNSTKENVFLTPRAYTRVGVDFGVFLGKN
ncbi:MAG TPA: hypothetical protein VHL80_09195 [Polyangia bacterium]|nr:hypothetical protein [Polyangia bacterium]